jgi:hypothetical protein
MRCRLKATARRRRRLRPRAGTGTEGGDEEATRRGPRSTAATMCPRYAAPRVGHATIRCSADLTLCCVSTARSVRNSDARNTGNCLAAVLRLHARADGACLFASRPSASLPIWRQAPCAISLSRAARAAGNGRASR